MRLFEDLAVYPDCAFFDFAVRFGRRRRKPDGSEQSRYANASTEVMAKVRSNQTHFLQTLHVIGLLLELPRPIFICGSRSLFRVESVDDNARQPFLDLHWMQ